MLLFILNRNAAMCARVAHRAALAVLPLVATLRRNDPRHGLLQELSDIVFAKHSAFSYEDLTSDKMGAIFGAEVFDPESDKSLGEQLLASLESLGASEPESAPN